MNHVPCGFVVGVPGLDFASAPEASTGACTGAIDDKSNIGGRCYFSSSIWALVASRSRLLLRFGFGGTGQGRFGPGCGATVAVLSFSDSASVTPSSRHSALDCRSNTALMRIFLMKETYVILILLFI